MTDNSWSRARLIPVSGIDTQHEAETRAVSALLGVLSIVRDFSDAIIGPLGASSASTATVDCYTEPQFTYDGRNVRPDGLIQVTYGQREWTALMEVKTGNNDLEADQVNLYWDIARDEGYDCVITLSNQIAPADGVHPTDGLRVQSNSPVKVHHLSWTQLLTTAVNIKQHKGVQDPEQAWLLGELIRYLQHPNSGALEFDDMGPHWVQLRQDARDGHLHRDDEGPADIAARWDQLIRYIALTLGAEIGEDVQPYLSRKHSKDPRARRDWLVDRLVGEGRLEGVLRIPNTAGDVELSADFKARTIRAQITIDAPEDRTGPARGTWLYKQLPEAPGDLWIEAYEHGARTPVTTTLEELREDRYEVVSDERTEPTRFVLTLTREMGMNRRAGGKNPSFTESVQDLLELFYRRVVQDITPWHPSPSKLPEDE